MTKGEKSKDMLKKPKAGAETPLQEGTPLEQAKKTEQGQGPDAVEVCEGIHKEEEPEQITLPMLPLRGMMVYPYMMVHLDVGRERSINAIEEAMKEEEPLLFLAMQKDPQIDEPDLEDIYQVGTVVQVRQLLKMPGGTLRILAEGLYRGELESYEQYEPYMIANIRPVKEYLTMDDKEVYGLMRVLGNRFEEYAKSSKKVSPEILISLSTVEEPNRYADLVAAALNLKLSDRQATLEEYCINRRISMLIDLINTEMEILELDRRIASRVRQQMEKSQKEYYLREQIKAIQKELGEKDERTAEVEELKEKIAKTRLPKEVQQRLNKELERLEKMPPMVAEAMVVRNYIDWVLALPWYTQTRDKLDIAAAQEILDADHFGLEKPKERIIEYLASAKLTKSLKGPILCLVGPPGVGKTSLARSIARALGRKFVRMSLGGVRDEAEIRGHRRTYIGSMPGRIIQNIRQAGTRNPLFLLDEIDKLGSDFRGDPSSALLEALDPEQNNTFSDHYIELPYDLSRVMFITTANVMYDIPRPLLDRMEIIQMNSYTEEEKFQIALRHLVPKQLKEHGLKAEQLEISDEAITKIIHGYTREAGVRELERRIAKICRRAGRDLVAGEKPPFRVNPENLKYYLGQIKYRGSKRLTEDQVGVTTGLAWTEVGGELLLIEVQTLPGKGKITITGQLGDVMKESVQAGYTYIRSISKELGIADNIEEGTDFHIHVPEGAIPKDGPSAGITMATAIASQLTNRPVRADLAMTGEVTLRGRVLPVGGIKEKVLAAYRSDCLNIILPAENEKDLEELPDNIREKINFHFVTSMEQVLKLALLPAPAKKKSAGSKTKAKAPAETKQKTEDNQGA